MWPFSRSKTSSTNSQGTKTITLKISGMHCVSCGLSIDGSLEDLPGVTKAETDYAKGKSVVRFNPDDVTPQAMVQEISKLGYQAEVQA